MSAPQPVAGGANLVESSGDADYYEMIERRAQAKSPKVPELKQFDTREQSPQVDVQIANNASSNFHQLDDSDTPTPYEDRKKQVD